MNIPLMLQSNHAPSAHILQSYVPECPDLPELPVVIQQGKTPQLELTPTCRFTHTENAFPQDGYHLLGALMRTHGLEHGLYSTHAACINGHLLVGHSGAGKTSVLLELLALGMTKLIATDKTFLDINLNAHGGTKSISLEAADAPLFNLQAEHLEHYGTRLAFMPNKTALTHHKQPVKAIWFVKLTDKSKAVAQQLEPLSALHRLYPFMMDKINADILLAGGSLLYKADDSRAGLALSQGLSDPLKTVPAFTLTGCRQAVATHISEWRGQ